MAQKAETSSWSLYYENMGESSFLDMIASAMYQWRFIRQILKGSPVSILEVGTGRGLHAILLSYFSPNVIGIDTQEDLVKKAIQLNRKLRGRALFLTMDAFHMGFEDQSFSVCCSQGFFEHFMNRDIRALIEEQLRVARSVIFSVPSCYYPFRNMGDERLLSIKEWQEILNIYLVNGFYYSPILDASKGFLGNLRLSTLRRSISAPKKAQICVTVTKSR